MNDKLKNIANSYKFPLALFKYYRLFSESGIYRNSQELCDFQYDRIKQILSYAHKFVPYYRNLFNEIGFSPEQFKRLEDIERIPYLDKETLRSHPEQFLSDEYKKLGVKFVNTSGSTGTPLKIAQDRYSQAAKKAASLRAMKFGGYRLGAKWFSLWGVYALIRPTPFGIDRFCNKMYYANNLMTTENNINVGRLLLKFKPVFYAGYGLSFLELGKTLKQNKIPIHSPRGLMVYGDWLPEDLRNELEDLYQTPVYDFYSHSENTVMINEKTPGKKFLTEDYFYPEFLPTEINPDARELVGTSFYNYAMPLIRYKTRDIIELTNTKDDNSCFRQVKQILGRTDDYLLMEDGRKVLSGQRAIYSIEGIKACQYIQDSYDHITINIISDGKFNKDSIGLITERMRDITKTPIDIDVRIVSDFEKNEAGKSPFIIRKIISK